MRHETFASIGNCGSTFPDASEIRSSRKGYSRSRTTRGKHTLLSLSLKLVFREWVAVEVQHPPAKCLEEKPLITSKMPVSLKVPDDLVCSVNENGHILPTHSGMKQAQLVCSISRPGDEELSQLADGVPLLHFEGVSGAHPSPRLFNISVLSTGARCVKHTLSLL